MNTPREILIDEPSIAIPYPDPRGGFGQVVVTLKPGESELVKMPNGQQVRVTRRQVH
jgi:hypothetical protein